jgi:hypothetical protein
MIYLRGIGIAASHDNTGVYFAAASYENGGYT